MTVIKGRSNESRVKPNHQRVCMTVLLCGKVVNIRKM